MKDDPDQFVDTLVATQGIVGSNPAGGARYPQKGWHSRAGLFASGIRDEG